MHTYTKNEEIKTNVVLILGWFFKYCSKLFWVDEFLGFAQALT